MKINDKNVKVVFAESLSIKDKRYIVINEETGEVLDDAQGYGYKSKQKAIAAFIYKNRDKSKDAERATKKAHIKKWMKEHKSFVNLMDEIAFEIFKGSWGPEDKFDSKLVAQMLKENELYPDFSAHELLKVWERG